MDYLANHLTYLFAAAAVIVLFVVPRFRRALLGAICRGRHGIGSKQKGGEVPVIGVREPTYTYDDLARNIVRSAGSLFPIRVAAVYLYDATQGRFSLRAQQGLMSSSPADLMNHASDWVIPADDPLIRFIGSSRDLVTKESVASRSTMVDIQKGILATLDRIEAQVCAPFLYAGQVKGLLVCGAKKDDSRFLPDELMAIHAFARMGDEIVRYLSGMEAELNYTSLYAHDMNNDTKSLVQTLQFLQSTMAAHQPREKILHLLEQAEAVAVRLNQGFELTGFRTGLVMQSIWGQYQKAPTDIAQCIRLACDRFRASGEKKKVSLKTKIPDAPVFVNGNSHDLVRIFENLLTNAFRNIDEGGIVEVLCEETPGTIEVIVQDNGRYNDPADVERIWSLGWQAKKSHHGASGFRLSIARQIVHLHQGRIYVSAQSGEAGTLFRVSIPLMEKPFQAKMGVDPKKETR